MQNIQIFRSILTLFAQKSPQALQSDLGPDGPRRIIGVAIELVPQFVHLEKAQNCKDENTIAIMLNSRENILVLKQLFQIAIIYKTMKTHKVSSGLSS